MSERVSKTFYMYSAALSANFDRYSDRRASLVGSVGYFDERALAPSQPMTERGEGARDGRKGWPVESNYVSQLLMEASRIW